MLYFQSDAVPEYAHNQALYVTGQPTCTEKGSLSNCRHFWLSGKSQTVRVSSKTAKSNSSLHTALGQDRIFGVLHLFQTRCCYC